jgi:homoserine O-acetyltransferase
LRTSLEMLLIMGSSPLQMQEHYPTRDKADEYLANRLKRDFENTDANDLLYQLNASRNYDPSSGLSKITVPVMAINSADDFINPPELNVVPEEIKKVPRGKFVLLPISEQTRGHGTHTLPAIWKDYLAELLRESEPSN